MREHANQAAPTSLVDGDMTTVTFRIPENLKEAGMRAAKEKGMSFSAFVRMCMIDRLKVAATSESESHA